MKDRKPKTIKLNVNEIDFLSSVIENHDNKVLMLDEQAKRSPSIRREIELLRQLGKKLTVGA